jgi:enoyl-CoA hydratase/carnithine racemase
MNYESIFIENAGSIATITLNRPEKLNAISASMISELQEAMRNAGEDPQVRVIVITGAGRAFCAGMDLASVAGGGSPTGGGAGQEERQIGHTSLPLVMETIDKPIIAAVNGAAIGWGMELVMLCDIKISSDKAVFGDMHVLRGVIADNGGLWMLPKLVGWSKAAEIYFVGDRMDAKEAQRIGLVNRVVPHEELQKVTQEMATKIASNAPLAVQMGKRYMRLSQKCDLESSQDHCFAALRVLMQTEDVREGARAFIEKRAPVFRGE